MKNTKIIFLTLLTWSNFLFAATAEDEVEIKKFLQCVEDDYRRKTALPQNRELSSKEIAAIHQKPLAALTRLANSAQQNSKSFENEIPNPCKPILEALARKLQSKKP